MDPCGHPPVTLLGEDQAEPTLTVMDRFVKNVASRRMMGVEAPLRAKAAKQCWKESRLKAFE